MTQRRPKPVESAKRLRRAHLWLAIFWLLNVPAVAAFVLLTREAGPITPEEALLLYISAASIYANFATHWGAWQAARAEMARA